MSEYRYFNGDTKHPYEYKACLTCGIYSWIQKRRTFCSYKCSKTGANNPQWQGANAGYMALHARIYRMKGKADRCVFDESHGGPYDWANLTGNYEDPNDFAQMCHACHKSYDSAIAKCFDKKCKRGHILNDKTMYKRMYKGREQRQCKQCAKDRSKAKYRGGE